MMPPFRFLRLMAVALVSGVAVAHPLPDIPVRSHFEQDGSCVIKVEIDPRCFTPDPELERYLTKADLLVLTDKDKQDLMRKATDALKNWVEFEFDPKGELQPSFEFALTGLNEAPLIKFDDPMVITGTWKAQIPAGTRGWRIRATEKVPFAVVFRNYMAGVEQPRFSVLFPGETSFKLELTTTK